MTQFAEMIRKSQRTAGEINGFFFLSQSSESEGESHYIANTGVALQGTHSGEAFGLFLFAQKAAHCCHYKSTSGTKVNNTLQVFKTSVSGGLWTLSGIRCSVLIVAPCGCSCELVIFYTVSSV